MSNDPASSMTVSAPKPAGAQGWETLAVAMLLALAGYAALFVAPTDYRQGDVQRIFYFHMPFGITSFVAFGISFFASIAYLRTRKPKWDWLAVSAGELGVPFVTVMLVTGPIWGHPVWGIWWTWDARLTSTLVLWMLYVCYLLLRTLIDDPERRAVVSAVFNIFAAFDVPFVYFSIWFFRTQHPQPVVGGGGYIDPLMFRVLLFCWAASLGVLAILLRQRYRMEALRYEVARLAMDAERQGEAA